VSGSAGPYANLQLCRFNYASTPRLSSLQAEYPSCRPANSVKALVALNRHVVMLQFCDVSTRSIVDYMSVNELYCNNVGSVTIAEMTCHAIITLKIEW